MTGELTGPQPPLALLLLTAGRWFDARSLARLAERGWPPLSPAQSFLFAHLDEEGTTPAELARRLAQTRQAVHEQVARSCRQGLLVVEDDPRRRGGRLVRLTDDGRRLVRDAYAVLVDLEAALGEELTSEIRRRLLGLMASQREHDARSGGDPGA